MTTRRHFISGAAALAATAALPPAFAQTPVVAKPARILLGFPPGGSLDSITRLVAEKLRGGYAPLVTVENRPGAAGRIAMDAVKAAEPDGTVMTVIPASLLVIYPHVYKRLSYDALRDFTPVSTVCNFQFGFSVGPAVPASVKTIQDFAQWCRANPVKASFGSPGEGTMAHFAGVMIGKAAGITMTHIPYKGGLPAVQDVVGGQIAASINVLSEPLPFAREGRVRVLATTGLSRSPFLPDVPTMRDAGFAGFDIEEYFAILMPARTPAAVVAGMAGLVRSAVAAPDLQEAFGSRAFQGTSTSGAALQSLIRSDYDKWQPIVQSTGFSIDS